MSLDKARSGPRGSWPLGSFPAIRRDPLGFLMENAMTYGDAIPFRIMGRLNVQVNHPDLVRHVLMDNHRNYVKSRSYVRFESAIGLGLLTSNGDKWRRDRQKIQPMFRREQVEGYYFDIVEDASEKAKRRWLALTEHGSARLNITSEMAALTTEIVLKIIFGKDNLDDDTVRSLHHSYSVLIDYLKSMRVVPTRDLRRTLGMPSSRRFQKELAFIEKTLAALAERYRKGGTSDRYNMLALLIDAQAGDPEHFSERDIRDHSVSMVFAGFESTSILMQWMWYALELRPDITRGLREEILSHAPNAAALESSALTHAQIAGMNKLSAVFMETMRLYPPFWVTSREPLEDDQLGSLKLPRGSVVVVPQITMHRHPKWWDEPNAFIPERFPDGRADSIDAGIYFPFSQGPRKCSGYKLVEMEAKAIFAKLLPVFAVRTLNMTSNPLDPGISLKLKQPMQVEISRLQA